MINNRNRIADKSRAATDSAALTKPWLLWGGVLLLIYLLLVGVGVIGEGFKWISGGADGAERIFAFASMPIVGVMLGTLATATVQSSSTVTSVIVGLVAGGVPVSVAIPMIMGANMGTTITNTIVSLGNFSDRSAFRRSFAAATVHDWFNLYSILIFLPIEVLFHPLERVAGTMADWLAGSGDASMKDLNFVGALTRPVSNQVIGLCQNLPSTPGALLAIAIGIGCVILSVTWLGKLLRRAMTGRAQQILDRAVNRGPAAGVGLGALVTILVQSSSTTTSLLVPFAGAGVLKLRQIYSLSLGANIGTCVTALLAATAVSGDSAVFALQIALVHLLYNLTGVTVFLVVPWLRDLPLRSADWLGVRTERSRSWAFGYIFVVFFALPGLVFGANALFGEENAAIALAEADEAAMDAVELEIEAEQFQIE